MSPIRIQRWGPDDWAAYRVLRLQALADAPEAFGTTVGDAERLTEAEWRMRLAGRVTFVAADGSRLLGLVSGISGKAIGDAELISMWVDPESRGTGVADQLVKAVIDWASNQGFRRLGLWVAVGNERAAGLYGRHGFVRTGESQPIRGRGRHRLEFAMIRELPG